MKGLAVVCWLLALACTVGGCETIYAAGGWELFFKLLLLNVGATVLSRCGGWFWKEQIE